MKKKQTWILAFLLVASVGYFVAFGQSQTPQTHVVHVNSDGTFTPQVVYIKGGDTVRWEGLSRTDAIIPADGTPGYPAMCSTRKAYNAADPNEFTGPMPFAPSGVFTLSPLDRGYIESTGTCAAGSTQVAAGDNGKVICASPAGVYEATLDSTWRSPDVTGVFIRLLWKDVNPQRGVFDFTVLQREMEKAVQNGKLFSLGIKAGDDGTPDWIFSTNADDSTRAGGGVPRLHLQDAGEGSATGCGSRMDLGNPANLTYRQYYTAMLTEVARVIKTRADWYRALAYMKISGANLFSHENRLPKNCDTGCVCNTAVLAGDGYRPSGLYAFYDEQYRLIHDLFPGKAMSYALIQDGFPRINETGGYMTATGSSSNSAALPGAFEQMQSNLDRGQLSWGSSFVVQHNGIKAKSTGCPFDGVHPKPLRALDAYEGPPGSACPNRWVVREGAERQITGFQTVNPNDVAGGSDLDSTFQNEWDNSDGVFIEIYEQVFWLAENTNNGVLPTSRKTIGGWADDFHRRRIDPIYPQNIAARDPFPATYSFTFSNAAGTPQYLHYVHGSKCGAGKQEWGAVVIDATSFTTANRGGTSLRTSGTSMITSAGYGRIRPNTGSTTPAGVAIFSYRSGANLVSETGVPATAAIRSGRIYAEVNGALDTGLAIANPNDQTATINFNFTDAAGNDLGSGSTTVPANQQIAKFLDQTPFKTYSGTTFLGTFNFTSDVPIGVIAIRGLVNERQDFLMSTLPVIDTSAAASTGTVVVPHFSDGAGWTTTILLVNPTSNSISGNVEFRNDGGATSNVTIGSQTGSSFAYSVSPRSSQKLVTAGTAAITTNGSVRILPTAGGIAPVPLVVFTYKPSGITLSEAGVAAATGTAFRMYVESSGISGSAGNIQSGIAIANNTTATANVTLELTNLDGTSTGLPSPVSVSVGASGHTGQFLAQFFPSVSNPFKGILRVSTTSTGISAVGLRARYNERGDFLITTTPPTNEAAAATATELLFPQLADGGGYTTQFILFSGTAGQTSSGSLILVQQSGLPLTQTLVP
jgi:hypothetical protein